ncbi:nitroreductase family protein [Pontibacter sp. BT310]|jgi:nitroreductase / dihydropteridine reductase|uniref:Nitroreductase family protein n=1 Tax=Pontibacter populi TaxID=890055 RepID=A0ABS6XBX0_9BACT|nr:MULTISPECIES: nitroreductase family protein [Pontibacter]MBJ6118646.1 nitroreductase family protein [Pontibacter sp. BT310]MBR0571075.1 nitroreductase family protein [Microvirga sp. STS03]MBW3365500.1 nitroreductase family protein [Pontibacter populi]
MTLINHLNWRYATKRMTGEQVPQEKIDYILEATRLSASSMGLQPYTVLVVEDKELRTQIQKVAYNQPQIVEASHLLIFAAWDKVTEADVDAYMQNIAEVRQIPVESLADFKGSLMGSVVNRTQEQQYEWAARQTYIALGTALAAAAEQGVDATPMEGFAPDALDELLNLKEKGLRSVTLMPIGYRNTEADFLATAKKVRREKEQLFVKLA